MLRGLTLMVKPYNPALHEEPRHQPTAIVPLTQKESLLDWLANSGRLVSYVSVDQNYDDDEDIEDDVEEIMDTYNLQTEEVEDLDI
jgi:hypothetical protein